MSGWIDYKEGDVIPEFGTEIVVKCRGGTVLYALFVVAASLIAFWAGCSVSHVAYW